MTEARWIFPKEVKLLVDRGQLIFQDSAEWDNGGLAGILGVYFFFFYFIVIVYAFILMVDAPFRMIWEWTITPAGILVTSVMILYITSIFWMPFLFFRDRMSIWTEGIQPSSSRVKRLLSGNGGFIDKKDIEVIFPDHVKAAETKWNRLQSYLFKGFVVITKDEGRYEFPWAHRFHDRKEEKDGYSTFKDSIGRFPGWFKEKWTYTYIPSKEEAEYLRKGPQKELDIKDRKQVLKIVSATVFTLMVFVGLMMLFFFDREAPLSYPPKLIAIICLFIGLPGFIFIMTRGEKETRMRGRIETVKDLIKLSDPDERKRSLGRIDNVDFDVDTDHLEDERPFSSKKIKDLTRSYSRKEISQAVSQAKHYRPGRKEAVTVLLIYFFYLSFFTIFVSPSLLIGIPLFILIFSAGVVLFVLSLKNKMFTGDRKSWVMTNILAEEARTGRRILPEGFQTPDWMLLKRGKDPLKKGVIDEARRFSRRSYLLTFMLYMLSVIGAIVGGIVLLMVHDHYDIGASSPLLTLLFINIPILLILAGGIVFVDHDTRKNSYLMLYQWEVRSGIEVLPDDVKEWLKKEYESTAFIEMRPEPEKRKRSDIDAK